MSECDCNDRFDEECCCFSCCQQKTYVQDKICHQFDIRGAVTQIVYQSNIPPKDLYASGYFTLNSMPTGGLFTITFYLNAIRIEEEHLTAGTTLAFTKTKFDTIEITTTEGSGTGLGNYTGEFCITPRYAITR